MLRNLFVLLIIVVVAVCATPTFAATVTYALNTAGNNWSLTAQASLGDNFGIAGYAFPLAGGITTLSHRTINSGFGNGPGGTSGSIGFTAVRTADASLNYVAAGIDTTQANPPIIRGLGQEASDLAMKGITAFAPVNGDNPWAVPLVIATGTWSGVAPTVAKTGDLGVNIFTLGTGVETAAAQLVDGSSSGGVAPNIVLNALGEREIGAGIINAVGMATGDLPITWSGLTSTLGSPAIAATLDAAGNFSWNPAGSKAGKKGSGAVKYQWTATATNATGPDTDVAFEVILIPEPATISLLGLAMVACVGVLRRRG